MVVRDAPEYNQPAQAPYRLALYDVESGELSKAEMPEEFLSAWNPQCSVYYNGISDDGTIVGYYKNSRGGESAFIMRRSDMTLVNFIDAFPTVGLFADSEDEGLNRVSAITPDGRYICGYGSSNFDYTGYVLDRGLTDAEAAEADAAGEAAVGILPANSAEAEITGYFDLSGRRLPRPAKGVKIVRRSDGSASKLIIP